MPEHATIQAFAPSIPATTYLALNRAVRVEMLWQDLATIDGRVLAIGTAAAIPAAYDQLHGPLVSLLDETGPYSVLSLPSGWTLRVARDIDRGSTTWVADENLYVCLFSGGLPPGPTDVPDVVVDLGPIGAT